MLEQRKMEAMHFTFKQISTFFTEVFKRLVPAGRAKLVLKTVDHEEGHEIGPDDKNADNFTGKYLFSLFKNISIYLARNSSLDRMLKLYSVTLKF